LKDGPAFAPAAAFGNETLIAGGLVVGAGVGVAVALSNNNGNNDPGLSSGGGRRVSP
jgi:hypothetical protein